MKGAKLAKIIMIWAAVLLFISACTPLTPPPSATPAPPDRLLFFGNGLTSYNLGLPEHLKLLAASADSPLTVEIQTLTAGTVRLKDHVESSRTAEIREGTWDVVILQEDPHWATRDEFFEAVRKFDKEIKAAGAHTVLFMPWERDTRIKFITTDEIAENHRQIAAELGIKVAPVGLAWQRSIKERPDLELYAPDRYHPSARGTYLAACVLYATIFEMDPMGLEYQPADMITDVKSLEYKWKKWLMTDEEVAFLKRIAWETVVDYQAQNK